MTHVLRVGLIVALLTLPGCGLIASHLMCSQQVIDCTNGRAAEQAQEPKK